MSGIDTVKACCFPILLVQSPKLDTYLTRRYCLKCWPVRFTYKAFSLSRPVPYKWGITIGIYYMPMGITVVVFHCHITVHHLIAGWIFCHGKKTILVKGFAMLLYGWCLTMKTQTFDELTLQLYLRNYTSCVGCEIILYKVENNMNYSILWYC